MLLFRYNISDRFNCTEPVATDYSAAAVCDSDAIIHDVHLVISIVLLPGVWQLMSALLGQYIRKAGNFSSHTVPVIDRSSLNLVFLSRLSTPRFCMSGACTSWSLCEHTELHSFLEQ